TMLVFYRDKTNNTLDKVAIARYDFGNLIKGYWDTEKYPNQYEALYEYIKSKNPKKIGINISKNYGHADGINKSEFDEFMNILPWDYKARVTSAEELAVLWLETRSDQEIEKYKEMCGIARSLIYSVFDPKYIKPGITTTDDLVWALIEKTKELGLPYWFKPSVALQRADVNNKEGERNFASRPEETVIQEGDLLHTDYGFTYLRMNTDQQQHFYVLKKGETKVPDYLHEAFKRTSRAQDILTSHFKEGRSGNEILKATLDQAKAEGLKASIYSHPVGFHGHAAGPTIGLWDQQGGVPGPGDFKLWKNTMYSIELNTTSEIKEWGKSIRIMLEEDGIWYGDKFEYANGRQTEIRPIQVNGSDEPKKKNTKR
ncbi:MAG TPA: M24 family metallopeptidase, partial [Saprospiraceae bacterium]|nr:M24 family metallopeptidase [Saprospiraceae bacterium]